MIGGNGGPLDGAKQKMVERAIANVTPSETDQGQAAAEIVAGIESEVASSVDRLLDAVDADDSVDVDHEERKADVLDVFDSVADGDLAERTCRRHGIDPDAARYATADGDEWERQKEEWAERHREAGTASADESVDEIADRHCRAVFDSSAATIERVLVDRSTGDRLTDELVTPTLELAEVVDRVADELEDEGDGGENEP